VGARISDLRRNNPRASCLVSAPDRAPGAKPDAIIGGRSRYEELRAIKSGLERDDYSVVVKNRARLPTPWRWEIYRAGRQSPIAHSEQFFGSRGTANLEGKAALDQMLKKLRL
jgi:hypothetical protein